MFILFVGGGGGSRDNKSYNEKFLGTWQGEKNNLLRKDHQLPPSKLGYVRKVLLETRTGYRIFKILIPFYIAATGNF